MITVAATTTTNISRLRQTIMACQAMFKTRAYIASPLVDKLRPEDVLMTYQAVIHSYTLARFHYQIEKSGFHRADLVRYGTVYIFELKYYLSGLMMHNATCPEGSILRRVVA